MDGKLNEPQRAQQREELASHILDSKYLLPFDIQDCGPPESLPVRHLPPGKVVDLYMLYVSACMTAKLQPASSETFRRVWKAGWYKCLKFNKASTHSQCRICHKLKAMLRRGGDFTMHFHTSEALMQHLQAQWADRKRYWALRARAQRQKDILCLIVDGMDRTKFALPRWAGGRAPKHTAVDANRRPVMELSAVLCHGIGAYLFLADENMVIGSNWTLEILMHALSFAWAHLGANSLPWPLDCAIQADNTNREAKNSILGRMCAFWASTGFFRVVGHQHLRVGHTHEDVGRAGLWRG